MKMRLAAVYRCRGARWEATIIGHPYILVEYAEDVESARLLLNLYISEEFPTKRWEIISEQFEEK